MSRTRLPAAESTCQNEKTILDHSKPVLSEMASQAIPTMVSLLFPNPSQLTAYGRGSLNRPTALCGPVRSRDSGPEDRLLRSDDTVKIRVTYVKSGFTQAI